MLGVDDFSWIFLFDMTSSWPMAHMLHPFMIQMFFQKTWLTLFIVWAWESVEVLAITLTQGSYVIFVEDDTSLEPVPDSLLGDTFQGVLGILLAKLVIFTFRVPSWWPSLYSPYHWIKTKRVLQYVCWVAVFVIFNYQVTNSGLLDVNLGVWILFVWTGIIILLIALFEHRTSSVIWKDMKDHTRYVDSEHFDWCFIGWLSNAWIVMCAGLIHYWYTYFQAELCFLVAVLWNVYNIFMQDRMWELTYFLNLRQKQVFGKKF